MAPLLLPCLVAGALAMAQDGAGDREILDSTRSTLAKWLETQQIIAKEKKEWQVGKDVLEQRVTLLQNEIADLEAKTAQARESLGKIDETRQEMVDENTLLKDASATLVESIAGLESKTATLAGTLPDPIRDRIRPLSQRIPKNPDQTEATLSERFQNVIGILNEVNKFNQNVTVTSEIRSLPDGSTAEVQALYIGVGHGYYVTASGNAAGIGRPGPDGWAWEPANEIAGDIARAIAIFQSEDVPGYVPLPVEIR